MVAVTKPLKYGATLDVLVHVNNRGESPVEEFILQLTKPENVKVVRIIEKLCERGELRNETQFNFEGKGLFAIKGEKARILCFFLPHVPKRTLVLVHAYVKEKRKLPSRHFETANRIRNKILASYLH